MSLNYLIVYKKTEEFLYKIYPKLTNYPKSEKFCLCSEIKSCIFQILKYISLGTNVKSKRLTYLQEADGYLQELKILMKLSRKRKYISMKFFEETDLNLTEINKILSGYIKSSK